jgi:NAD(P)-dependent dehydrogenase (short-subunit alcohol dehydrogenase family)
MLSFDPSRLGPAPGSRVAVVGGCGGMGRVLVRALLDTGVQVAVLDLPASLAQNPPPAEALSFAVDGSDADSVQAAFSLLAARWPHLDGFVNLAGFFKGFTPIAELPVALFDEIISGRGSLVSVASTMAVDVVRNYTHYGMAKAGIVGMVKGLARENAPAVRVNALAPGLTNTAFLTGGTGREKVFEGIPEEVYAKRVPMKRMAQPEDMTGPILFLLGAASAFVNGEMLIVDGGVYTQ